MCKTINFKVIFVTAFSVYAVQAFRFSATDFLLKPLKVSELIEAVNKVRDELALKNSFANVRALIDNLSGQNSLADNLVIPDTKGFTVVKTSEIIMCEADGYCTRFSLVGKVKISSSRNLKFYEELLPDNLFVRTHHSYLVNIKHVKSYSHNEEIMLTDGLKCALSSANKHLFISLFKNHK